MSQDTADIVGSTKAQFTLTVSAGNVRKAKLEAANQPDESLAVAGNVITIPVLPAGDSQVELQIVWAPGDTGAMIDVGTVTTGTATAADPKPTIESSSPIAFVELFGVGV
jgi:hypothetical protein